MVEKKRKEKRNEEVWYVCGGGKKKREGGEERIYNGNRGRGRRKMRKEGILGVVKKKRNFRENNKNEYLNKIELRIENGM